MKKLIPFILILISYSLNAQKGKPKVYGEVTLENNILYQIEDGIKFCNLR